MVSGDAAFSSNSSKEGNVIIDEHFQWIDIVADGDTYGRCMCQHPYDQEIGQTMFLQLKRRCCRCYPIANIDIVISG